MADKIQVRRDTASNWSISNPTLLSGEIGWETDTNKMKIGDGSTTWNSLGYFHNQAYLDGDPQLTDIAGLTPTDGHFIVGDGSNFVTETGATARASLGLAIGTDVQAHDANLSSFVDTFTLPTSDGTADQALATDGSGSLSLSTISAGGSFSATASGTLANGDKVVVNSDGTVSVVTSTSETAGAGSTVTFESASTYLTSESSTFDSNSNKVVVAYQDGDDSEKGKAVVGTVSGKSITFGSPVTFETNSANEISATFDSSNNKVVIVYGYASSSGNTVSAGKAVVGTVSGTSISFGSPVSYENYQTTSQEAVFDSNSNKVVIVFRNSNSYARAKVGTVSGTSISFGSRVTVNSAVTDSIKVAFDSSNNKVAIGYRDQGNSGRPTAIVGDVSGTSISFGSETVLNSSNSQMRDVVFDSDSNKCIYFYESSGTFYAKVGTVSSTSISFGSETTVTSHDPRVASAVYDPSASKVVVMYAEGSGSSYTSQAVVGTVSGTSISFGSPSQLSTEYYRTLGLTYDSNENKVVAHYMDNNSGTLYYGQAFAYQSVTLNTTNLTAANYVGIADAAYSDGDTANIQTVGAVDDAQSGLTAGQAYYVQTDGTLATTADSPSVFAGIALGSTKLLIKDS